MHFSILHVGISNLSTAICTNDQASELEDKAGSEPETDIELSSPGEVKQELSYGAHLKGEERQFGSS